MIVGSPKTRFIGWKLLVVLCFIYCVNMLVPLYGAGVLSGYMARDLGMSGSATGWMFAVYMLMGGLPGPLVAWSVEKWGAKAVMIAGGLSSAAGAILLAIFVTSPVEAVLAFGVLMGAGIGASGHLPIQMILCHWFVRRRAFAVGMLLTGAGIGGCVVAPALNWIVVASDAGWRTGWCTVAGLAAFSTLCTLAFVRNRPEDLGQSADGDAPASAAGAGEAEGPKRPWVVREIIRQPLLWVMLLAAAAYIGGLSLLMAHGVSQARALGHSASSSAFSMSLVATAALVGKAIAGAVGDRRDPRLALAFGLLLMCGGLVIGGSAAALPALTAYAMCFGIGLGCAQVSMPAMLANYFGLGIFARLLGFTLAAQTVVSAGAPLIGGIVFDRTGSFAIAFWLVAATCGAAAMLLLLVRKPEAGAARGPQRSCLSTDGPNAPALGRSARASCR